MPPLILGWSEFKQVNALNAPYLVVDTEGNGKDARVPGVESTTGTALACRPKGLNQIVATYVPIRHQIGSNVSHDEFLLVKELIENHSCIIMHNAKHDIVALENIGITTGKFLDTMLIEHFNNGKQDGWSDKHHMRMTHELDVLSRKYGGKPKMMPPAMVAVKNMMEPLVGNLWWGYVPVELMFEYSANDAYITAELVENQIGKFRQYEPNSKLWKVDQEFIRVIAKMEGAGVRLDKEFTKNKIVHHDIKMKEITEQLGGLNPNSPKDLKELLINRLKLPVLKESDKTGNPSFDKQTMKRYEEEYLKATNSPVANLIIAYRGYVKTSSANYKKYIELVSEDGRLRPNFNLHRTVTRRLSCNKPALQQLPRESPQDWNGDLKQAFIPEDGYTLWEIDYSQLELRLIASYANIPELIGAFNDPKRDVFTEMAQATGWDKIYGVKEGRQKVKTFSYMVSYGAGEKKVASEFGIKQEVAREMRKQFLIDTYPEIGNLLKACMTSWNKNGYIKLWSGRRIYNQFEDKPYAALDYVAQGGGAEIVERAMIKVGNFIDWDKCKMVLQVHDSLTFEIKNGEEDKWLSEIVRLMTDVPQFPKIKFPVEVKKWGTSQKWKQSVG